MSLGLKWINSAEEGESCLSVCMSVCLSVWSLIVFFLSDFGRLRKLRTMRRKLAIEEKIFPKTLDLIPTALLLELRKSLLNWQSWRSLFFSLHCCFLLHAAGLWPVFRNNSSILFLTKFPMTPCGKTSMSFSLDMKRQEKANIKLWITSDIRKHSQVGTYDR